MHDAVLVYPACQDDACHRSVRDICPAAFQEVEWEGSVRKRSKNRLHFFVGCIPCTSFGAQGTPYGLKSPRRVWWVSTTKASSNCRTAWLPQPTRFASGPRAAFRQSEPGRRGRSHLGVDSRSPTGFCADQHNPPDGSGCPQLVRTKSSTGA